MLTPKESALIQEYISIDGDGNVVGNDNTVQITKVKADTYVVQKDQRQVTVTVQDLRRVFNIKHSQIGAIGDHAHVDQVIFQTAAPTNPRERRNRAKMLQLVRNTWIKGVLEQSLHGAAMLELGKSYDPQAVEHPWDLEYHLPGQKAQPVPQGTSILEIFDQCSDALLILGDPGSGKTTTLLELARELIARAEVDETTHIPVVFNLSSWALKQQSLEGWLIGELRTKYYIPKKVAQGWLDNDVLLLLLDGLDEVKADAREECIAAINDFRKRHLIPLAVCSRTADYEALTTKLHLEGAARLRPLTQVQINAYLAGAGTELQAVRATLQHDPVLQEMAQSPLMLSIMTLAYHGLETEDLQTLNTTDARRQHLFDTYIERMFQRRTKGDPYPPEQTSRRLAWLAKQVIEHQQSVFLIENLQPDWLPAHWRRRARLMARLICGIILGLMGALSFSLIFVIFLGLTDSLIQALVLGAILGLTLGSFPPIRTIGSIGILTWSWEKAYRDLSKQLAYGLIFGLFSALIVGLNKGLVNGLVWGLVSGLTLGLVFAFLEGWQEKEIRGRLEPKKRFNQWVNNIVISGLVSGMIAGIAFGLLLGLMGGSTIGALVGFIGILIGGGDAIILHFIIRYVLAYTNRLPFRLVPFLDYCVDRIFLRRVGGGYIFIHRLLQEHFASLTPEDIERLAANADA
jgi:DNA polymerase III delta prime subunit